MDTKERTLWGKGCTRSILHPLCFNAFCVPLISFSVSVSFGPLALSAFPISVPIAVTVTIGEVPTPAVIAIWVSGSGRGSGGRGWRRWLLYLLLLLLLLLPDGGQLGPERADFLLILLANLAMLVFELIERLADDIQFINLRGHCRDTLEHEFPRTGNPERDSRPASASSFALRRIEASWRITSNSWRMASKESLRRAWPLERPTADCWTG